MEKVSMTTLQGCELSPTHLLALCLESLFWHPRDSVAHVSRFCPDRYSYDAQDHYQRQRILQKERAIVSDGGLGISGWGSTAPLSLQKAMGVQPCQQHCWEALARAHCGGRPCREGALCERGPAHGWGIPARRRSGELCLLARSPAG